MEEVKKQVQLAMTGRDTEEAVAQGKRPMRLAEGIQAMNLAANLAVMGKVLGNHEKLLQDLVEVVEYLKAILLLGARQRRLLQERWEDFQIDCLVEEAVRHERNLVEQLRFLSSDLWAIGRMRQLQQVYMEKKGGVDNEALKSAELPALPELSGDTGVEFSDWLYVAEQTIGAMSDSASIWYEKIMACVREAYARYQVASPLERLSIGPRSAPELLEPRWVRLDRKVMTLILAAMPKM
ncbi:unnamed protein product, partial [Symbiodinium necroappetens]